MTDMGERPDSSYSGRQAMRRTANETPDGTEPQGEGLPEQELPPASPPKADRYQATRGFRVPYLGTDTDFKMGQDIEDAALLEYLVSVKAPIEKVTEE